MDQSNAQINAVFDEAEKQEQPVIDLADLNLSLINKPE